jgi:hypothetical protein
VLPEEPYRSLLFESCSTSPQSSVGTKGIVLSLFLSLSCCCAGGGLFPVSPGIEDSVGLLIEA